MEFGMTNMRPASVFSISCGFQGAIILLLNELLWVAVSIISYKHLSQQVSHKSVMLLQTIARTVLEGIFDKPIQIQSYCAVVKLHRV
jgi:hypothetical protein